jgi:hypothetical protein
MRLVVLFGLAALAMAGCGGPTPYQPAMDGEGFAEQRLEPDRYRVRVTGNSITARETVQNQLLFRAAELTLQNGFERFVVVEQAIEPHTDYVTFDPFPPPYYGRRYWPPFATTYESRAITRYEAWAEIKMYPQAAGPRGPDAYEARAVIAQLRNTVLAPKQG